MRVETSTKNNHHLTFGAHLKEKFKDAPLANFWNWTANNEASDVFERKFKMSEGIDFKSDFNALEGITIPEISPKYKLCTDSYGIGRLHLLLIPNENKKSFAQCAMEDKKDCFDSYNAVKNTLRKIYPEENIYCIEHGTGMYDHPIKAGSSLSIAHAHLHFIIPDEMHDNPALKELENSIESSVIKTEWGENMKGYKYSQKGILPHCIFVKDSYLSVGVIGKQGNEKSFLYFNKNHVNTPSQILRKIIFEALEGNSANSRIKWDWKLAKYTVENNLSDTETIKAIIDKNKKNLIEFWDRLVDLKLKR